MKTLSKLTLLILFIAFSVACSDNDPTAGTNDDASLTAKVDGANFTSFEASIGASIGTGGAGDILAVQGSNTSGDYIRISLTGYTGTGTYTTGDNISNLSSTGYGTIQPIAAWTSTFDIGTGTVTITDDTSTHVKGTFSFEGYDAGSKTTKKITEGSFNAPKK